MSNFKNLAKKLLHEINSDDLSFIVSMVELYEQLENKNEPDKDELYLISALSQTIEKIKILESFLKEFSKNNKLSSNKLQDLYDKIEGYGSSKFYNY